MVIQRKIAVITGTRAEFGVLIPILKAMNASKTLQPKIFATGMHLQKKHGSTYKEILAEGFTITHKVKIIGENDSHSAVAQSVAKGIKKFTSLFTKEKFDMVFITGDRTEQLAATIAAALLRIPIVHYVGGERTKGCIDESIRHAITKFANIHLVKSQESFNRLVKLGEEKKNIFKVGFSGLDYIYQQELHSRAYLEKNLGLSKDKKFIVVLQHPVTSESEKSRAQMNTLLKAVSTLDCQKIILYPNSDPGSKDIVQAIRNFEKKDTQTKVFKNLPYKTYLSLIKYADFFIGNSSGVTVETIPFKTPVINIGLRQEGRERGDNIIDAQASYTDILTAIKKISSSTFKKSLEKLSNPFGDGHAAEKIVLILEKIKLDDSLLQKQITY